MKEFKKKSEYLKKFRDTIIEVFSSCDTFIVEFATEDYVCLFSSNRCSIDSSVLGLIPTNCSYRIVFYGPGLRLYIWFY